jgi:hypothetical protein
MKSWIASSIGIIALCGVCAVAPMQGRGRGNGKGNGGGNSAESSSASKAAATQVSVTFGKTEIKIIRDWFSDKRNLSGLPPGLAKKESLPPGLQKQLQRNGSLPPGLEKKVQPLPRELEAKLPRLPDDRRRVIISGSVILMDHGHNKILDVVANVY